MTGFEQRISGVRSDRSILQLVEYLETVAPAICATTSVIEKLIRADIFYLPFLS